MKGRRIEARPGQVVDRAEPLSFQFDGRSYTGYAGDTIASALTAAGVGILSRSFKYHRPRGLLCGAGHCPNCLVQIGDEPSVRSCTRPLEQGMDIRSQNAWPSLDNDLMQLTESVSRFLPVGFYYKIFHRPRFLWPAFEHLLRNAAGLGVIDPQTPKG
ncbi:MAG: 2Fe-2S iron-sulfur cluster-binding protein, partial [Candidatus Latescibacterota bacterium]|nr:2Fe-2S iron-sulfur cluster-binding protein [Candidatus Latescibacterota bacterium]